MFGKIVLWSTVLLIGALIIAFNLRERTTFEFKEDEFMASISKRQEKQIKDGGPWKVARYKRTETDSDKSIYNFGRDVELTVHKYDGGKVESIRIKYPLSRAYDETIVLTTARAILFTLFDYNRIPLSDVSTVTQEILAVMMEPLDKRQECPKTTFHSDSIFMSVWPKVGEITFLPKTKKK